MPIGDRVVVENTARTINVMRSACDAATLQCLEYLLATPRWQQEYRGKIAILAPASARESAPNNWLVPYANKEGLIRELYIEGDQPLPSSFYWARFPTP